MKNSLFKNYLDLFDKNCNKKPNAIAVKFGSQSLTYSNLSKKINQLANYLIKKGVKSEMLVGISAERSIEMIISLLAVHRVGAAYVPLDPAYPADRLKYMVEDSGLKLILSNHTSFIPTKEIETINLNQMAATIEREDSDCPSFDIKPDALAYVMYTSGSTGRPKGVMITHFNLMSFVELVPKVLDILDDDVYLLSASITYALSVRQIFVSLSFGIKLVVANSSTIQDPIELFKLIKDEKITLVDFVPAHWRSCNVILRSMDSQERVKLLKNNLRRIVTVGEPLLQDLPFEWKHKFNHPAQIVNIFGQTETTGLITNFPVSKSDIDASRVVSIGKPIPETQVYILDPESLLQIRDGEIGELCVSNACVAKGYLNNSILTNTKFLPNPFNTNNRNFLYRTGDLARYSPDGNIEYLGRSDQQVKIRGMRVELGEIEAVILSGNSVKEVAVVTQTRVNYGDILVAFLSTQGNQNISVEKLRNSVKAVLPTHMVPVSFIILNELPRTPNGKIDRKALIEYKIPDDEFDSKENTSFSKSEQKLLKIWKRLFKKNSVKITDNFFDDLGGDSLLAVLLFLEIEKEFDQNLAISNLYTSPTIETLAKLLNNREGGREFHSLVPIKPSGTENPLFLVHGAGGNVLIYRDLSKHLLENMPVYGLQSYGLEDASSPLTTIEEMANAYVSEIKKIQPSGPYFLCGYCMGGTVALQMAQELKSNGDDIAFLGMLETYNWSRLPDRSFYDKAKFLGEKIIYHWKNFTLLSSTGKTSFLTTKFNDLKKRTRIWLGRLISILRENKYSKSNSLTRQSEIWKLNDMACFKYQANYYDGRLTIFLPKKKYSVHSVPEAMWNNNHAKENDLVVLPFYPAGMLVEPFVRELAENINNKIRMSLPERSTI